MKYFAYGSNMSSKRLRQRVPSATTLGVYRLLQHSLRFHKKSHDGSAKCDAFFTGDISDCIYGVLFDIDATGKISLDQVEGLGLGYDEKQVSLTGIANGEVIDAVTYYATSFDANLKPYHWYLNHVLVGAREHDLPSSYIQAISAIQAINDRDEKREQKERAIYSAFISQPN